MTRESIFRKSLAASLLLLLPAPAALAAALPEPVGPGAPPGFVAASGPGAGEITLAWDAAPSLLGVSAYRVYRADAPGAEPTLVAELGPDARSYVDAGLANGATFYYRASAVDPTGEGPLSPEAAATTFTVPDAPQAVAVAAGPGLVGEATVSWQAPAADGGLPVLGYRVYRDGGRVAEVGADVFSWTDAGLTPLHGYVYSVSAYNAAGEGAAAEGACGMASPWAGLPEGGSCLTVL